MPEDRYWLSFRQIVGRVFGDRLIGPFPSPETARTAWREHWSKQANCFAPSVFYKEFDL